MGRGRRPNPLAGATGTVRVRVDKEFFLSARRYSTSVGGGDGTGGGDDQDS